MAIFLVGVFRQEPEIFPGASDIGDFVWDASIGLLAAWFFNLFAIALPRRREQDKLYYAMGRRLERMAEFSSSFLNYVSQRQSLVSQIRYTDSDINRLSVVEIKDQRLLAEKASEILESMDRDHAIIGSLYGRLPVEVVAGVEIVMRQNFLTYIRKGRITELVRDGGYLPATQLHAMNHACLQLREALNNIGGPQIHEQRIVDLADKSLLTYKLGD